jgi:haloalkane dehalogenase
MVLEENVFIEQILPQAIIRKFTDEELNHYRKAFRNAGEDRRPMLSWPRSLPIDGESAEVVRVVSDSCSWLAQSEVPPLQLIASVGLGRGSLHVASHLPAQPRPFRKHWRRLDDLYFRAE